MPAVRRSLSAPVLLLPGEDPAAWLDAHLRPRVAAPADGSLDGPVVGLDGLVGGGVLARAHAAQVAGGATAPAAAKWLAAWYPGLVSYAVGWVLGAAGAALVLDPDRLRFTVAPELWPGGLDLGPLRVAVAPDHPWAGLPGADVVEPDEVLRRALAPVHAVAPLVAHVRTLAKVGLPSLWAEVGDRLGTALSHDVSLPVSEPAAARLRALAARPDAPWRQAPRLEVEPTAAGAAYLPQKAGCCLAYQCAHVEEPVPEPGSWPAVYRAAFPPPPDRPDRCSTCSLLDPDDCRARQRLWVEHHRATT